MYPDAKRVLLTAYADTDAAIQAINQARIHHYLLKPWDPPEEQLYPVIDDLLDVTQSAEHTGKATGKDQAAGKLTFPGLLGIAGSRKEVVRLHGEAHDSLGSFGPAAQPLVDLCDAMAVRTK